MLLTCAHLVTVQHFGSDCLYKYPPSLRQGRLVCINPCDYIRGIRHIRKAFACVFEPRTSYVNDCEVVDEIITDQLPPCGKPQIRRTYYRIKKISPFLFLRDHRLCLDKIVSRRR